LEIGDECKLCSAIQTIKRVKYSKNFPENGLKRQFTLSIFFDIGETYLVTCISENLDNLGELEWINAVKLQFPLEGEEGGVSNV